MANKRKSMAIREEITRLRSLGHSQRKVSKLLGIHRNTVRSYWDDKNVRAQDSTPSWTSKLDWDYIKDEIKDKVPLKVLYQEQSLIHELPSYSSFCRYCSKLSFKDKEVSVPVHREPGESVETDYSGDSIDILLPSTGEVVSTELFVGTMSDSSKIYAEFSASQKLEDWISSHNRMFAFYGGVPKFEITDNLKSAVNKSDRYDPELNKTFHDMAKHYGIAIDPADVRAPQQKPNVERSVGILQKDFFPRVRNRVFTSIHELNKCLWDYLKEKNAEVMKDRGESRDFFFEKEKKLLRPLPTTPYKIFHWKKAKIHPDSCFQFQKNFYSVPHKYVGKEVDLKFNDKMVYVYLDTEQIKCHSIGRGNGHYIIDEKDYPEKKVVNANIHVQSALKRSRDIGKSTHSLIEKLFEAPRFPLKNLRKVQSVIGLNKKYSAEAVEYACLNALEMNKHSYHFIKSCARNYRRPRDTRVQQAPKRRREFICLQGGKR